MAVVRFRSSFVRRVPGTNGEVKWDFNLGSVRLHGDVLTVSMAAVGGMESVGSACQQALGVKADVVVSARSCLENSSTVADPSLAGENAERIATHILNKVKS